MKWKKDVHDGLGGKRFQWTHWRLRARRRDGALSTTTGAIPARYAGITKTETYAAVRRIHAQPREFEATTRASGHDAHHPGPPQKNIETGGLHLLMSGNMLEPSKNLKPNTTGLRKMLRGIE